MRRAARELVVALTLDLGVVERLHERGGGREPVVARLLHRLQHRLLERQREIDGGVHVADPRGGVREVHGDDLDLVLRLERPPARQHLVEDHAGGVDVGAGVDRLAERLLGREVLGRAEDDAGLGQRLPAALGLGHLGDAEVEDLDHVALAVALDQHDVLRLEIAVHDAGRVRVVEPAEDLALDRQRALDGHRTGGDRRPQRGPGQELHGEKERPVTGAAKVGRGDDVGVVEPAGRFGLALEPAGELLLARQLRQEDLDRQIAAHHRVLGAVDGPHPADADAADDPIALADDGADEGIGHRRAAAGAEGVLQLNLAGAADTARHLARPLLDPGRARHGGRRPSIGSHHRDRLALRIDEPARRARDVGGGHPRQRGGELAVGHERKTVRLVGRERISDRRFSAQRERAQTAETARGALHLGRGDAVGGDLGERGTKGGDGGVEARRGAGDGDRQLARIDARRGGGPESVDVRRRRQPALERTAARVQDLGEDLERRPIGIAHRRAGIAEHDLGDVPVRGVKQRHRLGVGRLGRRLRRWRAGGGVGEQRRQRRHDLRRIDVADHRNDQA